MQGEYRTCKKCGHKCHCYQPTCNDCINDVCTGCDCEPTVELGTDTRSWPWQDSGLDSNFR